MGLPPSFLSLSFHLAPIHYEIGILLLLVLLAGLAVGKKGIIKRDL